MYDVEEAPIFWLLESSIGLVVTFALQLVCGASALMITRSHAPLVIQYVFVLTICTLIGLLSTVVIDNKTHLINAILAGLCFGFVTPLQAFAYISRSHCSFESRSCSRGTSSLERDPPCSPMDVALRIAVPACSPSPLHPPDPAKYQVRRGVFYFTAASILSEMYDHIVSRGGVLVDIYALVALTCGAFGALNFTSASLSLFGHQTARPFRSPFLSPSMTQFWGGRWNAPVSDSLRFGIYEPLMKTGLPRAVCALVCFTISGISHEVILLYAGVRTSKGEWLTFFFLAGVATIVEKYACKNLSDASIVRRIISILALYSLFHVYFVPVTLRTGLAREGVRALAANRVAASVIWKQMFRAATSE